MLFALTDFGREMASRAARICDAGLMADCVDLQITDSRIVGLCPAWGGEIMAEITYVDGHGTGFATVHPQIKTPQIQEHGDAALEEDIEKGEVERIPVKTDSDISRPGCFHALQNPWSTANLRKPRLWWWARRAGQHGRIWSYSRTGGGCGR